MGEARDRSRMGRVGTGEEGEGLWKRNVGERVREVKSK